MAAPSRSVVVLGSLNLDIIASVERLPGAGETIAAHSLVRRFGGKGANQALAARKQGALVTMIGCVGDDAEGAAYRARFDDMGINMSHVRSLAKEPTGTALIAVDSKAENLIVVAAGANGRVTPRMIRMAEPAIGKAAVFLAQLEVPVPAVVAAMKVANRADVPVVFNPSPFRKDFPWGGVRIDHLIVNEIEARQLFRKPVEDLARSPRKWQAAVKRRGVGNLIVTRGSASTLVLSAGDVHEVPSFRVNAVDTVGAGDAFAGAVSAHLARGASILDAVRSGNAAGALATLKCGAQEAIPTAVMTRRMVGAT